MYCTEYNVPNLRTPEYQYTVVWFLVAQPTLSPITFFTVEQMAFWLWTNTNGWLVTNRKRKHKKDIKSNMKHLHGPTFLALVLPCLCVRGHTPLHDALFPANVHLRVGILTQTVPLAYVDESAAYNYENFPIYRGFQPDLLRALQRIAFEYHNVTLTFDIEEAPPFSYIDSFELLAEDCNTTGNPRPLEECEKYQFIVGDYYAYYPRPLRTRFTPPLLTTSASAIKYVNRKKRDIATLAEAEAMQEPVCLHNDSFFDGQTLERYPDIKFFRCRGHSECLKWLKNEDCVLMVSNKSLEARSFMPIPCLHSTCNVLISGRRRASTSIFGSPGSRAGTHSREVR